MGEDIFRITVDEPNYSRVLGQPIGDRRTEKAGISQYQGSRFWAQRNSQNGKQVYGAMEPGDGLLFYKVQRGRAPDEGQYVGTGWVQSKHRLDEEQATALFRTPVARLGYTVTNFTPIAKSIEEVEAILGYGSYPQSSHRVTDDRYTTVDDVMRTLSR